MAEKNPLLEESQGEEREGKFLIVGARQAGRDIKIIDFAKTQAEADAIARALIKTGWTTVEVYTRAGAWTKA